MKKLILLGLLLISRLIILAQDFSIKFSVTLPDSVEQTELRFVDLDNDGLLDVFVLALDSDGEQFFLTYKNDATHGLVWKSSMATNFNNASLAIADVDLDNTMDIILSGQHNSAPSTHVFLNQGDFSFTSQMLVSKSGKVVKMADLDRDGKKELLIGGQSPLLIYSGNLSGWILKNDSIKIVTTSLEVFDFDKDGSDDFFISGKREDASVISSVYYNKNGFRFIPEVVQPAVEGHVSIADLNTDGNFDFVLAGKNALNENVLLTAMNKGGSFIAKDSLHISLVNSQAFATDFDSNGKCDIHFQGINVLSDTVNAILNDRRETKNISHVGLQSQNFGDFDRDGDLDLIQNVKTASGFELVMFENKIAAKNEVPLPPLNVIGVTIFDKLFLYWDKPADDHTPLDALTYDLTLQISNEEAITGEFDLFTRKRLTVSHGNIGNKNYELLNAPQASSINYTVQSIDNSFHSGVVCNGSVTRCANVRFVTHEICKNETLQLSASANSLWFSFTDGFLGQSETFRYDPETADTVFSVAPGGGCTDIKAHIIKISKSITRITKEEKFVCEGVSISLSVESGWQSVTWSSIVNGFISNNNSINYVAQKNDTVKVKYTDGVGCFLQRNIAVRISKPILTLNGETFQILRNEQVRLIAEGANEYLWSPAIGLDHENIANPLASPLQTTQYVVIAKDSIGCSAQAAVLVIVEGTAFVPNLFTPNEDGMNDVLRVYGLNPVKDFSFTIHNREGSVVYETRNASDAVNVGWNGSTNGNKQPGGVYYWKVKGEQPSGRQVLLNGKRTGSIVLIR